MLTWGLPKFSGSFSALLVHKKAMFYIKVYAGSGDVCTPPPGKSNMLWGDGATAITTPVLNFVKICRAPYAGDFHCSLLVNSVCQKGL